MFKQSMKNLEATETIVGAETIIEGKIIVQTSLRVEGEVHGDIECEGDITIGEKGLVEHSISSRNVTIAGTVNGEINASGKVHILSSGKLCGNATMTSIVIDEGGIFEGESKMTSNIEKVENESA